MSHKPEKVQLEVIHGAEGASVYIGDENGGHRLAGPKPWGGGKTLHLFDVSLDELVREALALGSNKALNDVVAERSSQVKRFAPEMDDGYAPGQMTAAAIAYAMSSAGLTLTAQDSWPWPPESFKPRTPREDLVRAAALLLAEIERMDRAAPREDADG